MPKSVRNQPYRRWTFTLNNPRPDDANYCHQWAVDNLGGSLRYIIASLEHADDPSKTTHWQGYLELIRPQRLSYFKKLVHFEKAHFEPSYGNADQNFTYTSKEKPH